MPWTGLTMVGLASLCIRTPTQNSLARLCLQSPPPLLKLIESKHETHIYCDYNLPLGPLVGHRDVLSLAVFMASLDKPFL